MVYIVEKCNLTYAWSFSRFFIFFWTFINIVTGTLDGSLSLFALFVVWLVTLSNLLALLWTLNNSITETCMTSTILWKQFLNYMLLHKIEFTRLGISNKVQTCDSFTICTLVNLLYVISTSELVLIASKWTPLTFTGSISAEFILYVSLTADPLHIHTKCCTKNIEINRYYIQIKFLLK